MENPWAQLPDEPPFVAPADHPVIARYPKPAANLQLDLLPSPYVGTPDADVLLLMLNPGGRHDDRIYGPEFIAERRRALRFESAHCFWPLSPRARGTPAHAYAATRMRALIDVVGEQRVARRMMWVQYLGYQSQEWRPFPVPLPSQTFVFELVRNAIKAGKTLIVGRSVTLWAAAVPELLSSDYIQLRNPRSPYLTPRNMGDASFGRVVAALSS